MATKPNDFFATLLYQPNMSLDDLNSVGVNPDNTSLKDRSYYKDLDAVKEAFKDDTGKFNEANFNSFYDSALLLYNDYANKRTLGEISKNFKYDPFDWRYNDKEIEDINATISFEKNPMRNSINVKALNIFTDSDWSIREIAQTEKVFNYETGQFEDWAPNDKGGLWKGLFRPTLVLATYDEDGTHTDENGRIVQHRKGEYKYHPITGRPYYETLGNREIYEKDVLHISDTLTDDGSKINKFDFFDSDGLDKSVGGSMMKLTARLSPMLLGLLAPEIGIMYGGISAVGALAQLVPTLGKAVNGFIFNDNENTAVGKTLNKMEGWAARLADSKSDRSRQKMVTMENAASLVSDIAMQLFQQRSIQYIPRLFKNNPNIYNNVELAKKLSYAYMSGTSALESYSAFKQAGASDRVAGLGMIATMGAFYKLMSIDYFRDAFFRNTWFDDNNVKSPLWKVADDFIKVINEGGSETASVAAKEVAKDVAENTVAANQRTLKTLATKIWDGIVKTGQPWRPMPFLERSVAEGTEEVMEEVMQDGIKAFFKGAEAIGIPMNKEREKLDFGFSAQNALQRYITNFVGGFVGGAIFQGYNDLELRVNGAKTTSSTPDAHLSELVKLISDGRAEEIRDTLRKWHKNKRFGSNDLSATKLSTVMDVNGEHITASESNSDGRSQNDFIFDALMEQVNYVERVLNEESFKNLTSEFAKSLQKINPNIESSAIAADMATKIGAHSLVYRDLNRLATEIVKTRGKIDDRAASFKPKSDKAEDKTEADKLRKEDTVLKDWEEHLKELREQRDAIMNGDRTAYYVSQYSLLLNGNPLQPFLGFSDLSSFIRVRYGKEQGDLSATQLEIAKEEYTQYKNGNFDATFKAIDAYNSFAEAYAKSIVAAEKNLENVTSDSDLEITTIGNQYFKLIKSKDEANTRLEELNKKESLTEEETKEKAGLEEKIKKYNDQIDAIRRSPSRTIFNETSNPEALIEKIQALLNKTPEEVGPEMITEMVNKVKDAYKTWATSKTLKRSQSELDSLYLLIRRGLMNKDSRWQNIINWIDVALNAGNADPEATIEELIQTRLGADGLEQDSIFNLDESRQKRPAHERLEQLLSQLYDDLGKNESIVLEDYNKIVDFLKEQGLTDDEIKDFLFSDTGNGSLIPIIGDQTLPEFLTEMLELKSKIKSSILPELLKDAVTTIGDSEVATIMQMLENEQMRVASQSTLDKYTIDNPNVRNGLRDALEMLLALKGLVVGAADGTNHRINEYKKSKKYAEISKEAATLIGQELDEYINRINFLLKLDAKNRGFKLSEHKEIAVNMRLKFLEKLIDKIHSDVFVKEFQKVDEDGNVIASVNPKELWENEFKPAWWDRVNIDNYNEAERLIISYETELFRRVKELGFTQEQIADKVFKLLGDNPSVWKQQTTRLGADKEIIVSDYDFALYTLSVLTLNANDFFAKVAKSEGEKFDKCPVYGHEFIVRLAYAMMLQPNAFNKLLTNISKSYKGSDEYVKNRRVIRNVLFGFGGAGVGKSTSAARLFKELISDLDLNVILMASGKDQLDILAKGIGAEDSDKRITYSEFFGQIGEEALAPENLTSNKGRVDTVKKPFTYKEYTDILDKGKKGTIFICDESETVNELEWDLMSQYAEDHGIFVLALGDYKQPSAKIKIAGGTKNNGVYDSSFEELVVLKTPTLAASLRTLSVAKNDNYIKLDTVLDEIYEKINEDPITYWDPEKRNKLVEETLKHKELKLDYYKSGNRLVGDEIITEESAFKETLDKVINMEGVREKGILIVTDHKEKYQSDKFKNNPKVVVKSVDEALGGEFDYAFLDVAFDPDNLMGQLREFYMLTQRAQLYTAVLDTGKDYSSRFHISTKEEPMSSAVMSMNTAQLEDFKKWRLKGISELVPSKEAIENLTPETISKKKTTAGPSEETEEEVETEEEAAEEEVEETEESVEEAAEETEEGESTEPEAKPAATPPKSTPPPKPNRTKIASGTTNGPAGTKIPDNVTTAFDDEEQMDYVPFVSSFNPEASVANVSFDDWYKKDLFGANFIRDQRSNTHSVWNRFNVTNNSNYPQLILKLHRLVFTSKNLETAKDQIAYALEKEGFRKQTIDKYLNGQISIVLDNGNIIFRALYKDNDYLDIPIGKTSIKKNGIYTGWFEQVIDTHFEKATEDGAQKWMTLAELITQYPALSVASAIGILLGASENYEGCTKEFIERNVGKAFIAAGSTADFRPDATSVFKPSESQGKRWAYSQSDVLKLAGIQRRLQYDQVCKYLTCMDYMRFGLDPAKSDWDYEKVRKRNLQALGYIAADGKVDIIKIKSDLVEFSGNSEWNELQPGLWATEDNYSGKSQYNHLFEDYVASPAAMSILFPQLFDLLINDNSFNNNKSVWNSIRHAFGDNKKLAIKTKDGLFEIRVSETDRGKFWEIAQWSDDNMSPAIRRIAYDDKAGADLATVFKTLLSSANIDLNDAKILLLRKVVTEGITFWNVDNTNNLLYRFISPFIGDGMSKIEQLFKRYKYGFYANIKGTDKTGNLWKTIPLNKILSIYSTDAVVWKFATYALDEDAILPSTTTVIEYDYYQTFVELKQSIANSAKTLGVPEDIVYSIVNGHKEKITDNDSLTFVINNIVDEINDAILSKTNTVRTKVLTYDGFTVSYKITDTKDIAINNALIKNGFDLTKVRALWDAYRTPTGSNDISVFTDDSVITDINKKQLTKSLIVYEEDGEIVTKITGYGKELSDLMNSLKMLDENDAGEHIWGRNAVAVGTYLLNFVKNQVNVTQANKVVEIMSENPWLQDAIMNYLENRINSKVDEC